MSYVSNIADSILSHSGNDVFLSPEMYTAIAEWEKREIPATIVMDSIDEVFVQVANGNEVPVELFQEAVLRNFRIWLSSHSGSHRAAA